MQDGSDAQLLAKAAKAADEASHYEPRLHNKWLPLCPSHLHARSIPETDLLWQCQLQRSKAKTAAEFAHQVQGSGRSGLALHVSVRRVAHLLARLQKQRKPARQGSVTTTGTGIGSDSICSDWDGSDFVCAVSRRRLFLLDSTLAMFALSFRPPAR